MKASKLVQILQEKIAADGDLDLCMVAHYDPLAPSRHTVSPIHVVMTSYISEPQVITLTGFCDADGSRR